MPSCGAYTIGMKMIRSQVQLTEEQMRALRRRAAAEGISVAAVIRACVDSGLEVRPASRGSLYAKAMELTGSLHDVGAATDLSSEHDRYLSDAFS